MNIERIFFFKQFNITVQISATQFYVKFVQKTDQTPNNLYLKISVQHLT